MLCQFPICLWDTAVTSCMGSNFFLTCCLQIRRTRIKLHSLPVNLTFPRHLVICTCTKYLTHSIPQHMHICACMHMHTHTCAHTCSHTPLHPNVLSHCALAQETIFGRNLFFFLFFLHKHYPDLGRVQVKAQ